MLYENRTPEEALKKVDEVIAKLPNTPWPTWRAKVLLELNRTGARRRVRREESIRQLPQFPEAHNRLLKIYQKQGRTKEAAQQAEWLRDYERRMESH